MFLHPFHNLALVEETIVGRDLISVGQETVGPHAIVENDHDDVVAACINKPRAVIIGIAVIVETTALNEEEDGQPGGSCGVGWCVYIEEEAVL